MFDMVAGREKPITPDRILRTIDRYLAKSSRQQLAAAVKEGAPLVPSSEALVPGCTAVRMTLENFPSFDLGFDGKASAERHQVVGVREDGPAYKAGLRDGQKLIRNSYWIGQPDKAASFTVKDSDGPKDIQYFPRGKITAVPQFHLDSQAVSGDSRCNPR